ncbi:glycosyltransferase [Kitasatospora azatica]|uniref:glycosyltransferase n=1 Tax=Kitasatospora azatica TaxID=58347 RepID=UPI000562A035|nr:glycosyltransferase [Kitasatospora azatica]
MRILLATAGSRGDVAPYTGLGVRLQQAGHQVTIATHEGFGGLVRAAGLGFRALPVDPRAELASAGGQRLLQAGSGPRAVFELLRLGRAFMPALGDGLLRAAEQGTDLLLLSSTAAPLGQPVAEALGLPCLGVFLQPLAPSGEFPPVVAGPRSLGRLGNRLAGHAAQAALDRLFAPAVHQLRRRLGLPRHRRSPALRTLHGFSPTVLPRPADWHPDLTVTGYWWPAPTLDWQPPPQLTDFLQAGPPPVLVGFGSLVADAERLGATVGSALRAARVRAIVQTGWTGLQVTGGGAADDVLMMDELPHDWLFPQLAAVVHHAGAGTTAAGLRAGIPVVPVPAQLDAPFWSARLTALGVTPGPVPLRTLTAERLAAALRHAVREPGYRDRARAVADRIACEDGAAGVLRAVEQIG